MTELRSDARRNLERVLDAAQHAFGASLLVRGALTNAPAGQWRRHLAVVLDGLRA